MTHGGGEDRPRRAASSGRSPAKRTSRHVTSLFCARGRDEIPSAVEEQLVCGPLERCGDLPVGEAGLAQLVERLVAREHEEERERPGGRAVAEPPVAMEVAG